MLDTARPSCLELGCYVHGFSESVQGRHRVQLDMIEASVVTRSVTESSLDYKHNKHHHGPHSHHSQCMFQLFRMWLGIRKRLLLSPPRTVPRSFDP